MVSEYLGAKLYALVADPDSVWAGNKKLHGVRFLTAERAFHAKLEGAPHASSIDQKRPIWEARRLCFWRGSWGAGKLGECAIRASMRRTRGMRWCLRFGREASLLADGLYLRLTGNRGYDELSDTLRNPGDKTLTGVMGYSWGAGTVSKYYADQGNARIGFWLNEGAGVDPWFTKYQGAARNHDEIAGESPWNDRGGHGPNSGDATKILAALAVCTSTGACAK
jgi:hypothetical protein